MTIALGVISTAAWGHVGVRDTNGLVHGFSHAASGIDHTLVMVAVGLFAAHLGGRALWLVPLTFVSMVALAGVVGMTGAPLPFVEIGIGLSVVVLGLAIAFQINPSVQACMALVGFFAVFHGHTHGAEMPLDVSGIEYGIGFICATVLFQTVGIILGLTVRCTGQVHSQRILHVGGGAIAIAGVAMIAGIP
jgi:urease accessory protein